MPMIANEGVTKLSEETDASSARQPHSEQLLMKGITEAEYLDRQDMQMAADNSDLGLRMFPIVYRSEPPPREAPRSTGPPQLENKWTRRSSVDPLLNFWAKAEDKVTKGTTKLLPRKYDEVEAEAGKESDGAGASAGSGTGAGAVDQRAGTEMTISVPRYVTDHMGKWVFNPWGVTFGDVWEDTRFQFDGKHSVPWILVDNGDAGAYRMEKLHGSVCQGKSTIYNVPKIYKWFPRYIDTKKRNHRNILVNLRKEIYKNGRSENCHTADLDDWYAYMYCSLLRNMRMDYLVPNYPLHRWYNTD
ncbi:GL23531 [Drosophila persimilis]|uniref:GL23531 n=1 Tax=Drosophila persimilis TaxID=7234 RepID=B4G2X6_DROPE|nr:GL23531 [Drosophila persimilis]